MGRTGLYSIAGASIGFLVGTVLVQMMAGASANETTAVTLFVGAFLAGNGAIAGAITGAVAEFSRRTKQARQAHAQGESDSDV